MKNRIIALVVGMILLLFSSLSAQAPDTLWTKTFGESAGEYDVWLIRLQQRNPTIEVTPDSLVFIVTDSTVIGIYGFMYVKNVGILDTLEIDSITWTEEWVIFVSPDNFSVAPGDSQEVMSLFHVDGLPNGCYDDNLMIFSNDANCPVYYEPVRIIIAIPGIEEKKDYIRSSIDMRISCNPNPFTSVATIQLMNGNKEVEMDLTIYDASGRLVKSVKLTNNTYQFGADLVPGIYFLKLNGKTVGKVVKVK